MIFALLVFLAAFGIEGIGSYVSVIGLSALFAANPIIIVLAVTLDFAKVITVSFLYKFWSKINSLMKIYMTVAAMVLVTITSAGAFGFLSGEFQKAVADTGTQSIKIQSLEDEQGRLQKRKEEIDKQIASVPDKNTRGRAQLIRQFGPESNRINDRLAAIDKELPELKVKNVDKELHVGPIIYVAKAFNTTPEEAVKWVILTIIFVFDPLAIALLIAGNFLIELKRNDKKDEEVSAPPPMMEHINVGGRGYNIDNAHDAEETKKVWDQIYADLAKRKEETEPKTDVIIGEHVEPWTEEKFQELSDILDDLEDQPKTAELEPAPEPAHHARTITIEERDGRDVIALKEQPPLSLLEHVNEKTADIIPDDGQHTRHTMKLYTHYEDNFPEEPVTVGKST